MNDEKLLLNAIKSNNIDESSLLNIIKSKIDSLTFENLSLYGFFEIYEYKLQNQKCQAKCQCLNNCPTNNNFISLILDNNTCLYSVKFVLNIINNFNDDMFNKIISNINRFDINDNLLFLLNNINKNNCGKIMLFIQKIFDNFDIKLNINDVDIKNILNTINENVIVYFLCNKKINISSNKIYINENYAIYKILYDNKINCIKLFKQLENNEIKEIHKNSDTYSNVDFRLYDMKQKSKLHILSEEEEKIFTEVKTIIYDNDNVDIKAYDSGDRDFLIFCVINNCYRNYNLIDNVIKNDDYETLLFLLHCGYKYDIDKNNIDLIKSYKTLILILNKMDDVLKQIFMIKFLSKYSIENNIILFNDREISMNTLINDEILNNIRNIGYKFFDFIIKNYDNSFYKHLTTYKNNDLITLLASKYSNSNTLFAKLLHDNFAIHRDCILYICYNKNLSYLRLLLDKITKSSFIFFKEIDEKYKNIICSYFENDADINAIFDTVSQTTSYKNNILHQNAIDVLIYAFENVNEYNIDIYSKLCSEYFDKITNNLKMFFYRMIVAKNNGNAFSGTIKALSFMFSIFTTNKLDKIDYGTSAIKDAIDSLRLKNSITLNDDIIKINHIKKDENDKNLCFTYEYDIKGDLYDKFIYYKTIMSIEEVILKINLTQFMENKFYFH